LIYYVTVIVTIIDDYYAAVSASHHYGVCARFRRLTMPPRFTMPTVSLSG